MNNRVTAKRFLPFGEDPQRTYTNRMLLSLFLPLVLERMLSTAVGMMDTVMVSTAGEVAVSSISLVDNINVLLIQLFAALSTGGAVVTGQYIGAGRLDKAKQSARQLANSCLLAGLFLMAFGLLCGNWLLNAIYGNAEPAVITGCRQYFFLTALSFPFLAWYYAICALFNTMNNTKVSLCGAVLMNVCNICGNAVLIYGFNLGVVGAGTATLFARMSEAILVTVIFFRHETVLRYDHPLAPRLDGSMILRILHIGVPGGLENSMFQVGKILLLHLITSLGTVAVAANAITCVIEQFILIPTSAIGTGLITISGRCMGAENPKGASYYMRKMWFVSVAGIILLGGSLALFAPQVASLFNVSQETSAYAVYLIRLYAVIAVFILSPAFLLPNLLRSAGDVSFTLSVTVISMWAVRVACAYIFCIGGGMGLEGVWYAMFLDWLARGILFVIRFAGGKWKRHKII